MGLGYGQELGWCTDIRTLLTLSHTVYRTSDSELDELTWEKEPFFKIIESDKREPNVVDYEISRERRKFAFLI